jgi:general secretion pathway protein H
VYSARAGLESAARPRREHGFTLVELMVVLMIAALMLTLVGTSISRSISGAEMRQAANKVAASMRYTRTRAILTKSEQVFLLDTESRKYTAADREPVELPDGMNVELNTARSELTSETAGGIRFFPDGGSTGGNVRLEANGRIYRVNVAWLTGEASLERGEEESPTW